MPQAAPLADHTSPAEVNALSLCALTYNLHKGFSFANTRFVLHQVRAALSKINSDLVFLQEVQGEHRRRRQRIADWPSTAQFEFLADQLWPHYAYGKNAIYRLGHHGNAILSKYPFIRWENINISRFRRASRSLLHGVIGLPGNRGPVHVICIHFGLLEVEREQQIQLLVQRIRSHVPENEALILAGDFNDWRGRVEACLQHELGLQEVFNTLYGRHARSYPSWWPVLRMDRIYYRGLKALQSSCLHSAPWRKLSDHTPLLARFLT